MQTPVQSSPKSIQIKVGKNHRVETWTCNGKFRTEAQLLAVEAISKRDDFDFTCWDKLFEPEKDTDNYQGPFLFAWYDKLDVLHGTKIAKNGRLMLDVTAPADAKKIV